MIIKKLKFMQLVFFCKLSVMCFHLTQYLLQNKFCLFCGNSMTSFFLRVLISAAVFGAAADNKAHRRRIFILFCLYFCRHQLNRCGK